MSRRQGSAAKALTEALRKAMADHDPRVQLEAAESLWLIAKDKEAAATLVRLTRNPDWKIRADTAVRLGVLGPNTHPESAAALADLLWDEEVSPRYAAAEGLGRLVAESRSVTTIIAIAKPAARRTIVLPRNWLEDRCHPSLHLPPM